MQRCLRQIEEETGLTIEQVKDINRRMSIPGSESPPCEEWFEANCVLVISIAKYTNRGLQFAVTVQEGSIGLISGR